MYAVSSGSSYIWMNVYELLVDGAAVYVSRTSFGLSLDSRHDNATLCFASSSFCLMATRASTHCSS